VIMTFQQRAVAVNSIESRAIIERFGYALK
jgi:hypothetical protein